MEYQVPQFIEVENKVVGPLTLRQFIYLAGGGGLCFVCYAFLPLTFAVILSLPIAALTGALVFYKINGKSFIEILEAGFNYYRGAKLFLWKRGTLTEKTRPTAPVAPPEPREKAAAPRLSRGKLSELAWSLDIKSPDNAGGGAAPDASQTN